VASSVARVSLLAPRNVRGATGASRCVVGSPVGTRADRVEVAADAVTTGDRYSGRLRERAVRVTVRVRQDADTLREQA